MPLFIILSTSQNIQAEERNQDELHHVPSAEAMLFDGLIIRPLSLAGTVIGAGIFVVTLSFSLPGGNVDQAADQLVVEPVKATFMNCLGCIKKGKRSRN